MKDTNCKKTPRSKDPAWPGRTESGSKENAAWRQWHRARLREENGEESLGRSDGIGSYCKEFFDSWSYGFSCFLGGFAVWKNIILRQLNSCSSQVDIYMDVEEMMSIGPNVYINSCSYLSVVCWFLSWSTSIEERTDTKKNKIGVGFLKARKRRR